MPPPAALPSLCGQGVLRHVYLFLHNKRRASLDALDDRGRTAEECADEAGEEEVANQLRAERLLALTRSTRRRCGGQRLCARLTRWLVGEVRW